MLREGTPEQPGSSIETFELHTSFGHEASGIHISATQEQTGSLLYSIGWGTDTAMHTPTMQLFSEKGYDVWSVNPPRVGSTRRVNEHNVAEIELHKSASVVALLQKLKNSGVEQTDIVTHSEGAIYATLAAVMSAEDPTCSRVRSIIYVEPAGFMGSDNIFALTSRFAKQAAGNVLRDPELYIRNRRSGKGITRPLTSIFEAHAIASTNVPSLVEYLQNTFGTEIGVIAGTLDGVFPASRIEQTLKKISIPYAYKALNIRHNSMYTQGQLIVDEVGEMLQTLHVKK